MTGDVVLSLVAIPLTPIHVGDGSVLTPEDYDLDQGDLVRFSASAVLRSLPGSARKTYGDALDRGDLHGAWRVLRQGRRREHVLERIGVGEVAREEIRKLLGPELRAGEIRPMLRTGGAPCLPGSSLKGALRTAMLSHLAKGRERAIEDAKRRHRPPRSGPASDEAQKLLLGHADTDQDPFRFVAVSDIVLPAGSTRVDRVINWRPSRLRRGEAQPAEKMQMIVERIRAATDGAAVPMPVTLGIATGRLAAGRDRDRTGAKTPRRPIESGELLVATNAFHWTLFDEERERFYADEPAIGAALDAAFRVRAPDGTLLDEKAIRARTDMILLRVGRFCQFESKSLAGVRERWNPQAKPPRSMTVGNTRNLVKTAAHAPLVPFGWLLLAPPGTESVAQPATVTARPAGPSGRSAPKPPAGGRRWRLDGEEVTEISRDADGVTVEFANGDLDTVSPDELERL